MELAPISREGYEKLKSELDRLQNHEMLEVTKRVASARDMGDLSENAEYHAAREAQGQLEAKIQLLKYKLTQSYIVDKNSLPRDTVVFGSRVKIREVPDGDEEFFELVGPGEEDYDQNKILTTSPMGQALLGKKPGDRAEVKAPMGTIHFEILDISFPE